MRSEGMTTGSAVVRSCGAKTNSVIGPSPLTVFDTREAQFVHVNCNAENCISGDRKMSVAQWKKEAKRLVKLAIQRAGGQHAMSDSTGIDTSQLSRWGNEDDDERHIPLYRAMELDEAAGDAILKGWARWRGADLVFREHRQEVAENMHKLAASAAKAHGDFVATAHEAASHGVCTINEERDLSTKKQSHDDASDSLYGAVTRMKPN